ncbi:MAG: group 1 truncated hemoglobin [Nitrospirae bacterium]|nr:group 1 truncated hemoglobin [Nitrospirota bacterium]MDA1303106.1 group 1 truncated hemoglobin [Nitrospirota bacterium]
MKNWQYVVRVAALAFFVMLSPFLGSCFAGTEGSGNVGQQKTLYDRLGGYDAISAVVDEFLQRVWDDPVVGRYFVGMGTDTRNQLRQKNKNLLCFNTGGPCKKINRPLDVTHEGLGITDQEFDIVVNHLDRTLNHFKVPEPEHQEVLTKVGNLRSYVVEKRIAKH